MSILVLICEFITYQLCLFSPAKLTVADPVTVGHVHNILTKYLHSERSSVSCYA